MVETEGPLVPVSPASLCCVLELALNSGRYDRTVTLDFLSIWLIQPDQKKI